MYININELLMFKLQFLLKLAKKVDRTLLNIKDNFRKVIIVKDNFKKYNTEEGIEVISLKEWLLGGE